MLGYFLDFLSFELAVRYDMHRRALCTVFALIKADAGARSN